MQRNPRNLNYEDAICEDFFRIYRLSVTTNKTISTYYHSVTIPPATQHWKNSLECICKKRSSLAGYTNAVAIRFFLYIFYIRNKYYCRGMHAYTIVHSELVSLVPERHDFCLLLESSPYGTIPFRFSSSLELSRPACTCMICHY